MIDPERLQTEFEGEYHPVYVELKKLERDFPLVVRNQDRVIEDETAVLINTYASLLFSAQDDALEPRCPKDIRDALLALQDVNGFREAITTLVQQQFPQVIIVIERVYFTNRSVIRYFSVPAKERPKGLKKIKPSEWMYPEDRLDRLRNLCRKIWRQNVLTSSER